MNTIEELPFLGLYLRATRIQTLHPNTLNIIRHNIGNLRKGCQLLIIPILHQQQERRPHLLLPSQIPGISPIHPVRLADLQYHNGNRTDHPRLRSPTMHLLSITIVFRKVAQADTETARRSNLMVLELPLPLAIRRVHGMDLQAPKISLRTFNNSNPLLHPHLQSSMCDNRSSLRIWYPWKNLDQSHLLRHQQNNKCSLISLDVNLIYLGLSHRLLDHPILQNLRCIHIPGRHVKNIILHLAIIETHRSPVKRIILLRIMLMHLHENQCHLPLVRMCVILQIFI